MKIASGHLLRFALAIGVLLAVSAPSFAIEKHKKESDTTKVDTIAIEKAKMQPVQPKDSLKVRIPLKTAPIFNDFIDVNRNGVDDRLEQGGYLVPPKKLPLPTPLVKKADSTKAVPSTPPIDKPQKKDK